MNQIVEERRRSLFIALFVVVCLAPPLFFAWWAPPGLFVTTHYYTDDAFYYMKIARNLASGQGSTFDGITLTNGYHPLWMALLVPIYKVFGEDLILPLRAAVSLSLVLAGGGYYLLILALKNLGVSRLLGAIALSPLLLNAGWNNLLTAGLEAPVNFFSIALCIFCVVQFLNRSSGSSEVGHGVYGPTFLLGAVAGLAFLARLDNVFIVLGCGMLVIAIRLRTAGLRRAVELGAVFSVPVIIGASIFLIPTWLTFGHFMPISGKIKVYWAEIGGSVFGDSFPKEGVWASVGAYLNPKGSDWTAGPVSSIVRFFKDSEQLERAGVLALLALGSVGALLATGRRRVLLGLMFGVVIVHVSYYAFARQIEARSWYWVTEVILLALVMAVGFEEVLRRVSPKPLGPGRLALALAMGACLIPAFTAHHVGYFRSQGRPLGDLEDLRQAEWIAQRTQPGDIVATPNAGGIGYFSSRRIMNIDGLVNSYEYLEALRARQGAAFLKKHDVRYIFIPPSYLNYRPYNELLMESSRFVGTWSNPGGDYRHDMFAL